MGATSRANSVRFDETANQGHWAHTSRSSLDLLSRSGSGFGGLHMSERTPSHKSEGRASSVHSVRSATSGRANSLNLDTGFGLGESNRSAFDVPSLAPGLMILGSVPAIIRCWMNTDFKHDALLYAAVCTGSHRSLLDIALVEKLGFGDQVVYSDGDAPTITLPVYFPEAVPHPASSRSNSPAPQLPTMTVTFTVMPQSTDESRGIQIILGSDTLRMHNADIYFSSNKLSLFDDDRNKLSIPLVRPESEETFTGLQTVCGQSNTVAMGPKAEVAQVHQASSSLNGLGQSTGSSADHLSSLGTSSPRPEIGPAAAVSEAHNAVVGAMEQEKVPDSRPQSRDASFMRSAQSTTNTTIDNKATAGDSTPSRTTPSRQGSSSSAIWGNWRRDITPSPAPSSQFDWANVNKQKEQNYQKRDTGIKVLKPKSAGPRTFSSASMGSQSATDGRSRFFDEGKRRNIVEGSPADQPRSGDSATSEGASVGNKEGPSSSESGNNAMGPKSRANPAGGGSAFAWLNSGGSR